MTLRYFKPSVDERIEAIRWEHGNADDVVAQAEDWGVHAWIEADPMEVVIEWSNQTLTRMRTGDWLARRLRDNEVSVHFGGEFFNYWAELDA